MVIAIIKLIFLILPVLLGVAFLTLVERKVLASLQRRVGPNFVGFWGLLQPFADAGKLLIKEIVLPSPADRQVLILAPVVVFILSIISWVVIPTSQDSLLADINLGVSYIFAVSSLRRLWYYNGEAGLPIRVMHSWVRCVLLPKWFHMKFLLV